MANFFDESGTRVPSLAELRKSAGWQVGAEVGRMTDGFGADAFVPFSSFHRYERADSVWANEITTDVADYARGYSARAELLPAFVRYDCLGATWDAIDPPRRAPMVRDPAECGDDWSEELDADDERLVRGYFGGIEGLARHLDTVVVRVGGRETTVPVGGRATGRSVTFDVPRHSLVQALEWQVFDDLLIGNFMRTTLRGPWPSSGLYPGFTPFVTKYADNGGARSNAEVREYFAEYRRRMGALRWLRASFEQKARDGLRARLADDSPIIRAAKRVYQRAR